MPESPAPTVTIDLLVQVRGSEQPPIQIASLEYPGELHPLPGIPTPGQAAYEVVSRFKAIDLAAALRAAADEIEAPKPWESLPDEPEHPDDPRWVYEKLSKEQTYRGWPCDTCGIRRDEHADQLPGKFPELDITEHPFAEKE